MRRALRVLLAIAALLALAAAAAWVGFFVGVPSEEAAPGLPVVPPPESAVIAGADAARFPKQGENQCGAYSLALGLRLHGITVTGAALVPLVSHEFSWSETLSGTMPWKVVEEARRRGVDAQGYTARSLPEAGRLDALRRHLSHGRPVVLLIESERRSQHFVLLVGYAPDGFYEYDPNFTQDPKDAASTVDENGPLPGNRTLAPSRLLEMWGKGGIAGLYTWWYVPLG